MRVLGSRVIKHPPHTHRAAEFLEQGSRSQIPEGDQGLSLLCQMAGPVLRPSPEDRGSEVLDVGSQDSYCVDSWHPKGKVVWGTVLHSYFLK